MPRFMDLIRNRIGWTAIAPKHFLARSAASEPEQSLWFPYDICPAFISISYVSMSIFRGSMLVEGFHALICAHWPRPNNPNCSCELAASGQQCIHRSLSS
jgi:hypothetical protein